MYVCVPIHIENEKKLVSKYLLIRLHFRQLKNIGMSLLIPQMKIRTFHCKNQLTSTKNTKWG